MEVFMHADFIPRPDAAFDTFYRNITDYVLDNNTRWKHIPKDNVDGLETDFSDWTAAWEKTLVPHIPQLTTEKNRVRVTMERRLRAFINRFLRWPPVTDLDRDKMAIPNPDLIRTPQPVPTTVPEIEADSSIIRQLGLRVRDFGTKSWGKPDHVHSFEIAWGIMDARPAQVSELPHLESATANPVVLTFEEEERGLRVFFAARWMNNTAQPGPWSDIESAFVP
jgi:hypothetical protein